jgi:uncharacterized membrane protein
VRLVAAGARLVLVVMVASVAVAYVQDGRRRRRLAALRRSRLAEARGEYEEGRIDADEYERRVGAVLARAEREET